MRAVGISLGADPATRKPYARDGHTKRHTKRRAIDRHDPTVTIPGMPTSDLSRRAVVTAMGAITPIGNDAETYWTNLLAGVSGAGPITTFDTTGHDVRIATEVKDFDPTLTMDRKMARRMSRFVHFAVAAAAEAIGRSGIDFASWTPEQRDRAGAVVNTGGGGMEEVVGAAYTLRDKGPSQVSPFAIPALSGNMAAAQVSMKWGLTGPVITQVAACASGVLAFQDALRLIASGECDVVVAGGSEAPLLPMAVAALANMTALSKRNDDPQGASRPFDRTRDGFVFGEGAGILVVESAEHALRRGAPILAELIGAALTADAFHISAPEPSGRGASRAMSKAMTSAGIGPDDVDYVVAHGTSTPLNDATETKAIKTAFGDRAYHVPISSPKSMVGHTLGAAGALSAIAAVGSIRDGWIAPTINYHEPDPDCDLDYVPNVKRQVKVDTAMINGFGFGGQNAVAIFRRFEE
jgi:3-oxoacyl-[acyl-carrier-protein] synthase II